MNEFFASIYSWFYSNQLIETIMDEFTEDGTIILSSDFVPLGITTAVISFLIAVAFYIWPINHPRFKAWWAWLIMLVTNAVINFGLAFAFLSYRIGVIEDNSELLEQVEDQCGDSCVTDETLSVAFGNMLDLAFANVCASVMFFIIASLILTWFSTSAKYSPFRN